jgi:hypothetical protein
MIEQFISFADNHCVLAFWLLLLLFSLAITLVNFTLRVIVRIIRMINIAIRGWPPEHLDADGDLTFREKL